MSNDIGSVNDLMGDLIGQGDILKLMKKLMEILPPEKKRLLFVNKNRSSRIIRGQKQPGLQEGARRTIPILQARNKKIYFEKKAIDLSTCPLTFKLFRCFTKVPEERLSKTDLMKKIYGIETLENRSLRYVSSLEHRIIKLISRSRRLAEAHFNAGQGSYVQWFPYDKNAACWYLFQIKKEYFRKGDTQLISTKILRL